MRLDGRDTFADPAPSSGLGNLVIARAFTNMQTQQAAQAAAQGLPPPPAPKIVVQPSWGDVNQSRVADVTKPYVQAAVQQQTVTPVSTPTYTAPAPAPVDSRATIQPVTNYVEVSPGPLVSAPAPAPAPVYAAPAPAPVYAAPAPVATDPLTQVTDSRGVPVGPVELDPGSVGYGQLPPTGGAAGGAQGGGGGGLLLGLLALLAAASGG